MRATTGRRSHVLLITSPFADIEIQLVSRAATLRLPLFLAVRHFEAVLDLEARQDSRPFDLGYADHAAVR